MTPLQLRPLWLSPNLTVCPTSSTAWQIKVPRLLETDDRCQSQAQIKLMRSQALSFSHWAERNRAQLLFPPCCKTHSWLNSGGRSIKGIIFGFKVKLAHRKKTLLWLKALCVYWKSICGFEFDFGFLWLKSTNYFNLKQPVYSLIKDDIYGSEKLPLTPWSCFEYLAFGIFIKRLHKRPVIAFQWCESLWFSSAWCIFGQVSIEKNNKPNYAAL